MAMKPALKMALRTDQRMALLGRLRMAEWIEMPEKDFAREIERVEKDPLFQKLYYGTDEIPGIVRRQRWPRSRFHNSFYEANEQAVSRGERVRVEELLREKKSLIPKIRKIGPQAFERYFLYAEEALPLEEISRRTGLSVKEAREISDLLLRIGAEAEFSAPDKEQLGRSYSCLARLSMDRDETSFEFFSPYWARGLYQIRYDILENWKRSRQLIGSELKHLPHLLKRLETINLRQNTMFRILESLANLQSDYLASRRDDLMRPVSLRMLAHRLDLAPSTVSRALSGRSVLLPWSKEVPLIRLVPGRRRVLKEVLSRWLGSDSKNTDAKLAERLKHEYGIRVSRRTVNAVRNELLENKE